MLEYILNFLSKKINETFFDIKGKILQSRKVVVEANAQLDIFSRAKIPIVTQLFNMITNTKIKFFFIARPMAVHSATSNYGCMIPSRLELH